MANSVVLGMQWGDEGKGKIVDLLGAAFDAVVRFQGGNNAGHTVKFGDRHFALHLIPSGVLHPGKRCLLGNGMVIDPDAFFEELEGLEARGVDVAGRLFVSDRAQVILPVYRQLDIAREEARGKAMIGTTAKGIGPAYENKASRSGLRMIDLSASDLEARLERLLGRIGAELVHLGKPAPDLGEALALCRSWAERLGPMLRNSVYLLHEWIAEGDAILFEGAQGVLLDVDHGTYPYVTSSNTSAGGVATGSGMAPQAVDGSIGVLKAYTTRVGSGPFVTELEGTVGEYLRDRGNEFGTTTGRPRRCGWLDTVVARYSRMINGVDAVALTKLDVLDTLEEIRICVAYRVDGEVRRELPASLDELARAEPVYESVPGWQSDTVGIVEFDQLPAAARDYIGLIEEEVGAPVGLVSTGPRREETVLRRGTRLTELTGGRLEAVLENRGA
jgi:adenylosuccinate synthase